MYSEYCESLNNQEKRRYIDKIKIINDKDPYLLSKHELSTNVSDLPDLTYIDIVNYLVYGVSAYSLAEFKAYKSLNAYILFSCGWVLDVYTKKISDMFLVIGKVKHSQRLTEKPLNPWFICNPEGDIQSAHCTCMAGLGEACSHVAALMFFVQDITVKKEQVTVTSIKQYWGKPKQNVDFAEIKDINFSTPGGSKVTKSPVNLPKIPKMTDEEFLEMCGKLRDAGCNSAILNVVPGFNTNVVNPLYLSYLFSEQHLSKTLVELEEVASQVDFSVSAADAEIIRKETVLQSKSRKWFLYRTGRITASTLKLVLHTKLDAPALSTIKKICYPSKVCFRSKATSWGCKHEENARKSYISIQKEQHPNFEISSCGLLINPEYPHIGASPDGLIFCECCGLGCLEVKCPYCVREKGKSLLDHQCIVNTNGKTSLSRKHSWYYQVQCQLFVSQRGFCDFVMWNPENIFIERIKPDPEFWSFASPKAELFFRKVLLPELLGKVFTQAEFPDGSNRKAAVKKPPTILFL